ncbi:MAG: UvrD-helicase domain-containing protein [bacterium]|nr:UvrD-helicase domain-containing protein [bacterium]
MPPGHPVPFASRVRVRVDSGLLDDENRLAETVEILHRAWVERARVIVELDVDQGQLRRPEVEESPPWLLGPGFTFLRERLHFLVWANNWDLRSGEPIWWWARKAAALGAPLDDRADVDFEGSPTWVDGGPRGPLSLPVIHAESVESGRLTLVPGVVDSAEDLADDQRAAVNHHRGPARIIAPAGSGKTRTLNARLIHLVDGRGVEPWLVTAVAYNNRAAAEMRTRLERQDLHIRTIHSLGWRILREARPGVNLLDERSVRTRLRRLIPRKPRLNTDIIGPYIEALSDVRIALRDPKQVEQDRDDVPDFARVLAGYRRLLSERDEADYDEQVYGAIETLLTRPDLRREWQRRCRHLLVDEFQDLTPAYLLLIRLLASPSLAVFGVGDDDQTIYGYAGADPAFLLGFDRLFPGSALHALEVNYRSPSEVVEAAVALLDNNRRRIPKTIRAVGKPRSGTLQILELPDPAVTADVAARIVGWLSEGVSPGGVAVLARVNSALLPVLAGLDLAGVPLSSRITPGLLDRTVMRATMAWIRLALDPDGMWRQDLLEAARRPSRRINRLSAELVPAGAPINLSSLSRLARRLEGRQAEAWSGWIDDIDRVVEAARGGESAAVLDELVDDVGLGGAADLLDRGRTRVDRAAHSDDLVALRRTAAIYPGLADFEDRLRTLLNRHSRPGDPSSAGVTLSTVHRVKGMEWDRVVVFGVDEGLMPHALSADLEEERRVLHVAVTRGRHRVLVVADADRPSPFLAELRGEPVPAVPIRARPVKRNVDPPSRPAAPVDEQLLAKLKAWRLEIARERGVPAYVVFWDRTLEEIASTRPRSESELLEVSGIGPAKLDEYGEDVLELVLASPAAG